VKYLLDTSAISELFRKKKNEVFLGHLQSVNPSDLATSSVCVMELRFGCALKGDPTLWNRIQTEILDALTVLPFGTSEAQRCGDLLALLSRQGTPIGMEDTQIGATALEHQLTLVTANTRHFERLPGLRVENWLTRV